MGAIRTAVPEHEVDGQRVAMRDGRRRALYVAEATVIFSLAVFGMVFPGFSTNEWEKPYATGKPANVAKFWRDREKPFPADKVRLVARLWTDALSHVSHATKKDAWSGKDGIDYYFFDIEEDGKERFGSTWSPGDGTRMQALVLAGETLAAFVDAPTAVDGERALSRLETMVDFYGRTR
jgi:hypothetical protein